MALLKDSDFIVSKVKRAKEEEILHHPLLQVLSSRRHPESLGTAHKNYDDCAAAI